MRRAVAAVSLVAFLVLLTAAIPSAATSRAHPSFLAFVTVRYANVLGGYEEQGTIWTADLDGSDRQRLAAGNVPDISPDGRWIAFRDNAGNLRVIAGEGGASRVLARDVEGAFDWAPDSRRIAVVVGGDSLVVVDIASRRVAIDRAHAIWGFSFSPSGDQIVWGRKAATNTATTGGVDIFRGSASGGHVRRLTHDRGSETPIWGPDGLAFARFEPFTLLHPVLELWFMRPDGRGLRSINPHNLAPFAWSRDGRRLLAYADSEVDSHPYAVDPASGTARGLIKGGAETFTAAFSRDGRWVLATHNGKLVQVSWAGGRQRILARGVDEVADWTR